MKKLTLLAGIILLLFATCKRGMDNTIKISGAAQGTTYNITYLAGENANYRTSIDSILKKIDSSLSTYLPVSIISRINQNDSTVLVDELFTDVFSKSIEVSEKTGGVFDVTVAPVVNAWGFGFKKKEKVTQGLIDSLLPFVGYKKIKLQGDKLIKESPQVMLDFNAIAQGYTVDVLAKFLERQGIDNYLVEVGGELRASGKKLNDSAWTVGLEQPNENPADESLKAVLKVQDQAMATSGNYRRFYVEDGKKFTHILNPFTGYPAKNNLLSASVIAKDCMTADAYATAFMVMGVEKSKAFLAAHKELQLDVFFIYDEDGKLKTYSTRGIDANIEKLL